MKLMHFERMNAWEEQLITSLAPWEKKVWLDKLKPDPKIPVEDFFEVVPQGGVLHGFAGIQSIHRWHLDPLLGLETWCSVSTLFLNSPEFPSVSFLQFLPRLIDCYAQIKGRKQILTIGWRADCLSGMWREMVPLKSRAWKARAKWEAFYDHLVKRSAVPSHLSPLTVSIMMDKHWNHWDLELLKTFLIDDVNKWSDELGKTFPLVQTLKPATICRMVKLAAADEQKVIRQALRLDLLQQTAKDFPRLVTWHDHWMAVLDLFVTLGDPLLVDQFDRDASAVSAGFPSAFEIMNRLLKAQKANRRHPNVVPRDNYLAQTPIYNAYVASVASIFEKFGGGGFVKAGS